MIHSLRYVPLHTTFPPSLPLSLSLSIGNTITKSSVYSQSKKKANLRVNIQKRNHFINNAHYILKVLLTVRHSIQRSETNVMHILFNLLRIKGHYMFRALLAYSQEALHKRLGILHACYSYVGWLHQN
jgi:hypothetical protein